MKYMQMEFLTGTVAKSLRPTVTALCRQGIRILSLGWPVTAKLVIV
jgi:hypothetical protein